MSIKSAYSFGWRSFERAEQAEKWNVGSAKLLERCKLTLTYYFVFFYWCSLPAIENIGLSGYSDASFYWKEWLATCALAGIVSTVKTNF